MDEWTCKSCGFINSPDQVNILLEHLINIFKQSCVTCGAAISLSNRSRQSSKVNKITHAHMKFVSVLKKLNLFPKLIWLMPCHFFSLLRLACHRWLLNQSLTLLQSSRICNRQLFACLLQFWMGELEGKVWALSLAVSRIKDLYHLWTLMQGAF